MKYKKFFFIIVFIPFFSSGQITHFHLNIRNTEVQNIKIVNHDYTSAEILFGERNTEIQLKDGKANWLILLSEPIFISLVYETKAIDKEIQYTFLICPGDSLILTIDSNNLEQPYQITGIGSINNQPMIQPLHNYSDFLDIFSKDSIPDNAFSAIVKKNNLYHEIFDKYLKSYNPTEIFKKRYSLLLEIYTLCEFIEFKGTRQFNIPEQFFRNEIKWQILEDSLIRQHSFDNDELLDIPIYAYFLPTYLIRVQERCWIHPELIKQYTNSYTTLNDLLDDPQNLLRENIVNKHFKGKSAEFLYACLFMMSINNKEENLPEIFNRFEQKYPQSQYIIYVQSAIDKIMERRKRILSDKMILIDKTDSLQTMNDLLKMFKGQTVLLDMWGTWCGPCRSELSLNADLIKNRFDSTNLTFVYVANNDTKNISKWKELISYYNLVGTHILASENLTKSIMKTIKGTGYPTYLIVRKNGTYIVSEAGFPMNKDILYNELEGALKID